MARIELGKIYDLRGQRDAAIEQYRAVLSQVEAAAPALPAEDALQTIGEWVTDGWQMFLAVFSYQSVRDVLQMLLREPYSRIGDQ